MNMRVEFYVINDQFSGEVLTNFDEANTEAWDWGDDNILEGNGVTIIKRSARFWTLEEALNAKKTIETAFRKSNVPDDEIDFVVMKITSSITMAETLVYAVEIV
jgi:hypothetical protein